MTTIDTNILWRQFGAAIDMLENAIRECPDVVWTMEGAEEQDPWYLAYHTLFWLDLYLSGPIEGFAPPAPFGLEELDPAGVFPERPYTQAELLEYLEHSRAKLHAILGAMSDEVAARSLRFGWGDTTYLELLLYNMRHVQHGAAQLNLILRQETNSAPRWVGITKRPMRHPGGGNREGR